MGRSSNSICWWTLLAAVATLSLLIIVATADDFEGFDAEEHDVDEFLQLHLYPPPLPTTTLTQTTTTSTSVETSDPINNSSSSCSPPPPPPLPIEDWDEDEFEGIPETIAVGSTPESVVPITMKVEKVSFPKSFLLEISCVCFLLAFTANYFTGRRDNERIALVWATGFASKGSVLDENFSLMTGDRNVNGSEMPLLLKEGHDKFKLYASGRRFCQGLVATLELRSRHDLLWRIADLMMQKEDTVSFEVFMNEENMDHVVFALARKKVAKVMCKEEKDLQRYASLIMAAPGGRKWVVEDLLVISESKEVAGDLLTDVVLDQVFGERAFEEFGKGLVSLHFSDQHRGSHKKMLTFKFALPNACNMADMTRLVALVPYYIDLVGHYKLSSQAHSKPEAARVKAAQEAYKELQSARQEALQKRKAEKKKIEEAETKLGAEVIRKMEERERSRLMKKSVPRVKTVRSH